jgi:hypothetical protein
MAKIYYPFLRVIVVGDDKLNHLRNYFIPFCIGITSWAIQDSSVRDFAERMIYAEYYTLNGIK